MTILVCPLSRVEEMIALHRPGRVISLLDPASPFPELGPRFLGRHLRLRFHDVHVSAENHVMPSTEHVGDLLKFLVLWDRSDPLLIHCRAGIGRSPAAAFIAVCFANPSADEREIAVALRRAAPLARPNEGLIRVADSEMGRGGRMRNAIAVTGRGLPWIDVDENEPFQLLSTIRTRKESKGGSYTMSHTRVTVWSGPPEMDVTAPQPGFEREGDVVWVAYRTARTDHFAILRFTGVCKLFFGDPNDETLETHRFYPSGLRPYQFHEIKDDPDLDAPLCQWVITFHDDTLEVTATNAEVLIRATRAPSASHAIAAIRP